jgi:exodeoxyribonuclease V alpha subunit
MVLPTGSSAMDPVGSNRRPGRDGGAVDGPLERSIALHAGPLLRVFNAAGVISAADVHVAQRLGRLTGESDERVLLAGALTVRALRAGSVCLQLDDLDLLAAPEAEDAMPVADLPWPLLADWVRVVQDSPAVAVGLEGDPDRPLRWVGGRLYLDRYWRDEQRVRLEVDQRLALPAASADLGLVAAECRRRFPATDDARQRLAAAAAVLGGLTVITGGPGTGKTTTVARVIATLQTVAGPGLRVALAAPTGKAAARLQEAVRDVVATMDAEDQRLVGQPEATTIHRLLGWKAGSSTRFRHDRDHHLPHDVVVVDETSMVSLSLMARLLEALRPDARLLLVGDPDQLASVEAGAVLGDLVARATRGAAAAAPPGDAASRRGLADALATVLPNDLPSDPQSRAGLGAGVVRLEIVHRHGAQIGALAAAIRLGQADETLDVLRQGHPAVTFVETDQDRLDDEVVVGLRDDAVRAGLSLIQAALDGEVQGALTALESHRLLLAHRRGPAGVAHWAERVERWVTEAWSANHPRPVDAEPPGPWYPGRPLLVSRNDRDTGLYNGDTGVIVADGDGGVVAAFGDPQRPLLVRPHRLPSVDTVYAVTVHRGQGSQFDSVSLVLPPATSPLLTRELFYTAVTRARSRVRVIGSEDAVRAAVGRPVRRASGLRDVT